MLAVGLASVYTLFPLSVVTCLYVVILREAKEYSKRRGVHIPFWRAPLTVSLVVGEKMCLNSLHTFRVKPCGMI